MNILVLGGTRYIGKALVSCLAKDNHVTIFSRSYFPSPASTFIHSCLYSFPIRSLGFYDVIFDFTLMRRRGKDNEE